MSLPVILDIAGSVLSLAAQALRLSDKLQA
jgi:hypothetical protein